MILREMKPEDLDEVLKIEEESFKDPWTKNMFSGLFSSPQYKSFVYEAKGQIAGYTSVIATSYAFEIMNLAVKKDCRRQGIARVLLGKILATAIDVNADEVLLEVRRSNLSARKLYENYGFKVDGVRPDYYGDEDAILMSLSLKEGLK